MPLEDFDLDSLQDGNPGRARETVPETAAHDSHASRRGIIDDFTLPSRLEAKLKRRRSRGRDRSGLDKDWSEAC